MAELTIHKVAMNAPGEVTVLMPEHWKFLDVQDQGGQLQGWFMVDPNQPLRSVHFSFVGTGWDMDPAKFHFDQYLKTVQLDNGEVYHLFRVYDTEDV